MTVQSIATSGTRQVSQARRLIGNVTPARESMEQTVEKYSAEDVIVEGALTLVRSKFSAHRYYVVNDNACSCLKTNCPHMAKATAFRAEHVEVVEAVKPPTPSQARKMIKVEGVSAQVMRTIAYQDAVLGSLKIEAYQTVYLVESDRFPGYRYAVIWDGVSSYKCSCGKPRCTAHTRPVSAFVHVDCARVA
jgi:hypothetical protein